MLMIDCLLFDHMFKNLEISLQQSGILWLMALDQRLHSLYLHVCYESKKHLNLVYDCKKHLNYFAVIHVRKQSIVIIDVLYNYMVC